MNGIEKITARIDAQTQEEIDRLHAKQEEDSRRAREFRAQMERAKENARSRGEAEAKRILADAKSAADAAFRELDELRKGCSGAGGAPRQRGPDGGPEGDALRPSGDGGACL